MRTPYCCQDIRLLMGSAVSRPLRPFVPEFARLCVLIVPELTKRRCNRAAEQPTHASHPHMHMHSLFCALIPQVSRLSALLEASKLQAALNAEQLMADLADERLRAERLRAVRDDALMQRCASCT